MIREIDYLEGVCVCVYLIICLKIYHFDLVIDYGLQISNHVFGPLLTYRRVILCMRKLRISFSNYRINFIPLMMCAIMNHWYQTQKRK